MSIQATLRSIRQDPETGRVQFTFASGHVIEFMSKPDAFERITRLDSSQQEGRELAQLLLLLWWLRRDPTAATPGQVIGKTITIDLLGTPVVTVV